jgi:Domain of unknown function (DUF6504)
VRKFVSRPLVPASDAFITPPTGSEPPLPAEFRWGDRTLAITNVVRTWRSTKIDRGDAYLKRHWFECRTACGCTIEVYYDREARRGTPQWWLYIIDE